MNWLSANAVDLRTTFVRHEFDRPFQEAVDDTTCARRVFNSYAQWDLPTRQQSRIRNVAQLLAEKLGIQREEGGIFQAAEQAAVSADIWRYFEAKLAPDANHSVVATIWEVFAECSVDGWAGENSRPVSRSAAEDAERFVRQLGTEIASPDVVPEPDGDLALEWTEDGNTYVVTFKGHGQLIYAGLLPENTKLHGTQHFGTAVPRLSQAILSNYFPAARIKALPYSSRRRIPFENDLLEASLRSDERSKLCVISPATSRREL